jgi:PAS domain-containing protein
MMDTIKEREEERDAARKQEQTTSEIFSKVNRSSFDAIIGLDSEMRISSFNPAAERITGYTVAEAIGAPSSRSSSPKTYGRCLGRRWERLGRLAIASLLRRPLKLQPSRRMARCLTPKFP